MTNQPFTSDPALPLLDDSQAASDICCVLPPSLRLSSAEAEELSAMFKALGHPVRLQIVDLLSRFAGQVCVCDVENQFELSQPTISHHLKILREAGLVAAEQRGLWVFYYLRPAAVDKLRSLLDGVR
jgi:ArsR family transcriptional regulator, arsenate/arsenite/antimonite-responsive transcriptional repressor